MHEDEPDPETKRRQSIELANAYREMMAMFAWKHLNGVILERIREQANQEVDRLPIAELTVAHVAEARGIRKCLDSIGTEIAYLLSTK